MGVRWTGTKRNSEGGQKSSPVLSRLWTKVHEIFGRRRRPFTRLSMSISFLRIFAIKSRSRRKTKQMQTLFGPNFFPEETTQLFYGKLLARFTVHRLAKFGWVPFADLHLRSLAMNWNAEFTEVGWKLTSHLKLFVDQSSCRFETM